MTLSEIEQALQERLIYLQKRHDEGFERPSWDVWLEVYRTLAQVEQAIALERIVSILDSFRINGVPVERLP
jgi:hypothetical protein